MSPTLTEKIRHLGLDWLVPDWPAPPQVIALSTTRSGPQQNLTDHPHSGFNLGQNTEDDPLRVANHRAALGQILGLKPLWLQQTHDTTILSVEDLTRGTLESHQPWQSADSAVSQTPGIAPVICTADCLPILCCNQAGTIVASIHAGWRSLAHGIIEKTITTMPENPQNLMAWLGPAITAPHFEVGPEVYALFLGKDPAAESAFYPSQRESHWHANLYILAKQRLLASGITAIYGEEICTYEHPQRFYSYRRAGQTGRMAGLIALTHDSTG